MVLNSYVEITLTDKVPGLIKHLILLLYIVNIVKTTPHQPCETFG